MVATVVKYSDGGKVVMPPRNPPKPVQMPRPQAGPKPKRVATNPRPRPKAYADGGKVARKGPKTTRDTIAAPKSASAADAMRNQRTRQEQLLGLKDGGKVRRR
jgi:hypothetical protein